MKKRLAAGVFLFFLALPAPVFLQSLYPFQDKPLDVPYVPSKPEVVSEMLRMAKVAKDDLLYDLGCGDGRIVITAAQLFGTRGVGIDIDPERIKESKENAAEAGVSNLVKFFEQDIFEADFHEASVVSLYLLTSVNLRLRPKLLTQLRPGTRVVSHNYAMDTWKPDDSAVVMVNDQSHNVYLWIVPANVSGTWEWTWAEGDRKVAYALNLDQHFQWPAGELKVGGKVWSLRDVSLKGNELQFKAESEEGGKTRMMTFSGKVGGNTLEGTAAMSSLPSSRGRAWKAKRNPVTMKPLDSGDPAY
jgi:SAM-dependent methyltransferase